MNSTRVFGQKHAHVSQFFYKSQSGLTRALVNLKPVVPGHVLVIPKRRTSRFAELTSAEVADLWLSVQRIGPIIQNQVGATALSLVIQDGPASGQTIDHVHVHILPRKGGDFKRNDEVYDRIEEDTRVARTAQEMADEASVFRQLFDENERFNENDE